LSISPPKEKLHVTTKLRYSHQGVAASVFPESDNKVRLELDVPERAVTPGQAAVFYQDEILLGGGWINDLP
jgi:tRNA-specific 2-thiouridylase